MERFELKFGNDMSRIVRGIAIILMVMNHSLPGKIIGFAVPLFSFLVGYGYAFAREKSVKHSLKRIWHLLSDYWFVLFAICMPTALLSYPKPISFSDVALGMFGLNPKLNFYAWYIYFYIFAMVVMPLLSRLIDRIGWKSVVFICMACGLAVWDIELIPNYNKQLALNAAYRCIRYLPIVILGYWLASNNIVAKIKLPRHAWTAVGAVFVMVGIYFFRGLPYVKIFDLAWAPIFAFATATFFTLAKLSWLKTFLTQMGLKSMNIWFLHALFFTHATKGVFGVLTNWITWKPAFVVAVLVLSFLLAITVDAVRKALSLSLKKLLELTLNFVNSVKFLPSK